MTMDRPWPGARSVRPSPIVLTGAFGVVEERPAVGVLYFHPPAEFAVVGTDVDEPGVCIFRAFDVLGLDDGAGGIEYSIGSHAVRMPRDGPG